MNSPFDIVNWVDFDGLLAPEEHPTSGGEFVSEYWDPNKFSVIIDLRTGVVYTVTGPTPITAVLEGAPDEP